MNRAPINLAAVLRQKTTLCFNSRLKSLALRGDDLVWDSGEGEKSAPLVRVRRVLLIGRVDIPASIVYRLARLGVPIDWLSLIGEPVGQILPAAGVEHDCALAAHAGFNSSPAALELARACLLAKFDNCREVLRRRTSLSPLWSERRRDLLSAADVNSLRGAEGAAARLYFSHWPALFDKFVWTGRVARPAPDPLNLLLSFGYSLIYNRLVSSLRFARLDPRAGFFHRGRGTHCALASDLMEPLRPLADAVILTIVRRRELKPEHFKIRGDRCVFAGDGAYPATVAAFEKMFDRVVPFVTDDGAIRMTVNDCLDALSLSFAGHILRGEPVFIPRLAPCPAS